MRKTNSGDGAALPSPGCEKGRVIFMNTMESLQKTFRETCPPFDPKAILDLIGRVAGSDCRERFTVRPLEVGETDAFILSDREGRVDIQANSGVAAAGAFRTYLGECLGMEYTMLGREPLRLSPEDIRPVGKVIRRESRFLYRYFLNYCTFGYTFAFWDFPDFERLLDYMAMSGYNLALNILGHETVVRQALRTVGYPEEGIRTSFAGPAFLPWQWMQNLSEHGGPLPDGWFEARLDLARKFNARAAELGIRVLLPGFGGMVPKDFGTVFPASRPIVQGDWCGLARPDILPPDDPMFGPLASAFYRAVRELLGGEFSFFAVDPFHEGGISQGVDLAAMGRTVYETMAAYFPRAVWVLQGWQGNPSRELFGEVDRSRVLITDLLAQYRGDGELPFDYFRGYPWLYCTVNNFGAQRQLRGHAARSLRGPFDSLRAPEPSLCVGYGLMMEGLAADDVLYDIYGEAAFREEAPALPAYIRDYARRRYRLNDGEALDTAARAWQVMAEQVYVARNDGVRESIFCARPGLHLTKASVYGTDCMPYAPGALSAVVENLFLLYDELKDRAAYRFDLIDFTRQVVSNKAWEVYGRLMDAYDRRDKACTEREKERFLSLMELADGLCSGCEEMRLDTWVLQARQLGRPLGAEALMEENARRIITLWASREGSGLLHDYAQKEWAGLLSGLYRQRWNRFFEALLSMEEPKALEALDYLDLEEGFVTDTRLEGESPREGLDGLVDRALREARS